MTLAIVVMGESGTGKDTFAAGLPREVINFKFSAMMKRQFEEWYGVPPMSFDDRAFRLTKVPGEDFTYLDVMIRACKAWESIDDKITARPSSRIFTEHLKKGRSVVFTDVRKQCEVDYITDAWRQLPIDIVLVRIRRQGVEALGPDSQVDDFTERFGLLTDAFYELENDGDISQLQNVARHIYEAHRK